MSSDAREIIAHALWRLDCVFFNPAGPQEYHRSNADALIAKLRAAGLLVEPGSETRPEHSHLRIEYAVQVPGEASVRAITLIRRYAMLILDDLRTSFPDAYLVTRHHIVHDEPWQPVDASGETP